MTIKWLLTGLKYVAFAVQPYIHKVLMKSAGFKRTLCFILRCLSVKEVSWELYFLF